MNSDVPVEKHKNINLHMLSIINTCVGTDLPNKHKRLCRKSMLKIGVLKLLHYINYLAYVHC